MPQSDVRIRLLQRSDDRSTRAFNPAPPAWRQFIRERERILETTTAALLACQILPTHLISNP